jgi:hypothetical protein
MNPHNALHRQVITAARFHPTSCNIFAYSTSKGAIKICDMRAAALCDRHAKSFEEPLDPSSRSPPPPHTHPPTRTHFCCASPYSVPHPQALTHNTLKQFALARSLTDRIHTSRAHSRRCTGRSSVRLSRRRPTLNSLTGATTSCPATTFPSRSGTRVRRDRQCRCDHSLLVVSKHAPSCMRWAAYEKPTRSRINCFFFFVCVCV